MIPVAVGSVMSSLWSNFEANDKMIISGHNLETTCAVTIIRTMLALFCWKLIHATAILGISFIMVVATTTYVTGDSGLLFRMIHDPVRPVKAKKYHAAYQYEGCTLHASTKITNKGSENSKTWSSFAQWNPGSPSPRKPQGPFPWILRKHPGQQEEYFIQAVTQLQIVVCVRGMQVCQVKGFFPQSFAEPGKELD